ncbi:hypothetical protein ACROYT_G014435 [Oculina patagonica]
MDMARMPFGLIEYNIRFFNADSTVRLKMEEHYVLWQETILAHFGHKWEVLNSGPMWQYGEEEEQDNEVVEDVEEVREVQSCDILAQALSSAVINQTVDEIVHTYKMPIFLFTVVIAMAIRAMANKHELHVKYPIQESAQINNLDAPVG